MLLNKAPYLQFHAKNGIVNIAQLRVITVNCPSADKMPLQYTANVVKNSEFESPHQ